MDGGLAAELGVDGVHGQAVRLLAAVSASFTDAFVDHHPRGGGVDCAALTFTAFLCCAFLVVDEHRDTGDGGEVLLHLHHVVAVADLDPAGQLQGFDPVTVLGGDDDLAGRPRPGEVG